MVKREKPMKPICVMAVLGRLQAVEINLRMLSEQGAETVVVTSNQEDEKQIRAFRIPGVTVSPHPNNPLGKKWQHGVLKAISFEANPLIIVGSDDFLSEKFIERACFLSMENDFIFFNRWTIHEPKSQKSYSLRYKFVFPLGSGRVFSGKFLKRHPRLFDVRLSRRLDDHAWNNLTSEDKLLLNPPDMHILAVKGSWSVMNTLENILVAPTIDWKEVKDLEKTFGYSMDKFRNL